MIMFTRGNPVTLRDIPSNVTSILTPTNEKAVEMPEAGQGERKLHLQEEIKTLYEHPEEGGEVEVPEENLASTQHMEGQSSV